METRKKFSGSSMAEAINKVKESLGADAMIISSKKIAKPYNNPYAKDIFEVEAMIEDKASIEMPKFSDISDDFSHPSVNNNTATLPKNSANVVNNSSANGVDWVQFFSAAKKKNNDNNLDKEKKIEAILKQSIKNTTKSTCDIKNYEGASVDKKTLYSIQNELISIKDMLYLVTKSGLNPDFLNNHSECLGVYAKFIKLGISERCSQKIINDSYEKIGASNLDTEGVIQFVLNEILDNINCKKIFKKKNKRSINAFVGPTGVGKTTTIAKLAAHLTLEEKKKVGLISIDNYRIGALEQLKAYAAIMGIPCLSAFKTVDLKKALSLMEDKDVVLIDTAGHSHLDNARMLDLKKIIVDSKYKSSISTHLVLSATNSRVNMKESVERFNILKPESYLFTKIDETKLKGGIIEQIMDFNIPISYITNGQKVPEDIMKANKKNVLQLLLN